MPRRPIAPTTATPTAAASASDVAMDVDVANSVSPRPPRRRAAAAAIASMHQAVAITVDEESEGEAVELDENDQPLRRSRSPFGRSRSPSARRRRSPSPSPHARATKRDKALLLVAQRAEQTAQIDPLPLANVPLVTPPLPPPPIRAAHLGFHRTRHGSAVALQEAKPQPQAQPKPKRAASKASKTPTAADAADSSQPPPLIHSEAVLVEHKTTGWQQLEFGPYLAYLSDSMLLDPSTKTRGFRLLLSKAGSDGSAAAAATAVVQKAHTVAEDDDEDEDMEGSDEQEQEAEEPGSDATGFCLGFTTDPPDADTFNIDSIAASQLSNTFLVTSTSSPSYDKATHHYSIFCRQLAVELSQSSSTVSLSVSADGTPVLHVNGKALPLELPAALHGKLPTDQELYPLVAFPKSWRCTVKVEGLAGCGLSLEEQALQKEARDHVEQALARGLVHAQRLAFEAVEKNDLRLLRGVLNLVPNANAQLSVDNTLTPLALAYSKNNLAAVKLLQNAGCGEPFAANSIASESDSGTMQSGTFNHRLRNIGVARGGKQGNLALVEWNNGAASRHITEVLTNPAVEPRMLDYLLNLSDTDDGISYGYGYRYRSYQNQSDDTPSTSIDFDMALFRSVRSGNVSAAVAIVKHMAHKSFGVSQLHVNALATAHGHITSRFQPRSIATKLRDNNSITALHMACINPNTAVLEQLYLALPQLEEQDRDGSRPLHYAAVCKTTSNIKFLLARNADVLAANRRGETALTWAVKAGLLDNVKLLLDATNTALKARAKAMPTEAEMAATEQQEQAELQLEAMKKLKAEEQEEGEGAAGEEPAEEEEHEEPEEPEEAAAAEASDDSDGAPRKKKAKAKKPKAKKAVNELPTAFDGSQLDSSGFSVLHHAAGLPEPTILALLVAAGGNADILSRDKLTPLAVAAREGRGAVVAWLLERKDVFVDAANKRGLTALHLAAKNGHYAICEQLLRHGADIDYKDTSGHSAAHFAAAYGYPELLHLLQHYKADLAVQSDWKTTPLSIAVIKGNSAAVMFLLTLADQQLDVNGPDARGRTLLHNACSSLSSASLLYVKEFVRHHAKVDAQDLDGATPLFYLASSPTDHPSLVPVAKVLLDAGADLNLAKKGVSPLMAAVDAGRHELVQLLLSRNASVAGQSTESGDNVLHHFFKLGATTDLAPFWHSMAGPHLKSLLAAPAKDGFTPILAALKQSIITVDGAPPPESAAGKAGIRAKTTLHDFGLLSALLTSCLDLGLDINQAVGLSEEQLQAATGAAAAKAEGEAEAENEDESDADDSDNDNAPAAQQESDESGEAEPGVPRFQVPPQLRVADGGLTLLHFAARDKRNLVLLQFLLSHGADANQCDAFGRTPLMEALDNDNLEAFRFLAGQPGINLNQQTLSGGDTLLMMAARKRPAATAAELVQLLLAAGADPHQRDLVGRNALFFAVSQSHEEVVRLLIAHKADVNAAHSVTGITPLMQALILSRAATNATFAVEELLIKAGADIQARDADGRTLAHFAFVVPKRDSAAVTWPTKTLSAAEIQQRQQQRQQEVQRQRWQQQQQQSQQQQQEQSSRQLSSGAGEQGAIEVLSTLFTVPGIQIDVADSKTGRTPLMCAAVQGAVISTRYLLQRGADLSRTDADGNSVLALALLNGQVTYAVMLMTHGLDLQQQKVVVKSSEQTTAIATTSTTTMATATTTVYTIFGYSVANNYMGLTYLLLDAGVDVFAGLSEALTYGKYQLCLTMLSKTAASKVAALNASQQSLLHILSMCSQSEPEFEDKFACTIAKALIDKYNLSLEQRDSHGKRALEYACQHGHLGLMQLYLSAGQKVFGSNKSPTGLDLLFANPEWPQPQVLLQLLQLLVEAAATEGQASPPAFAADTQPLVVVTRWWLAAAAEAVGDAALKVVNTAWSAVAAYLLKTLGVDPNAGSVPPLHAMVEANQASVVEAFLELAGAGLDLCARTADTGYSVLHVLVAKAGNAFVSPENVDLLKALVKQAGSAAKQLLLLKDQAGKTAADYAVQQTSARMVSALQEVCGGCGIKTLPPAPAVPPASALPIPAAVPLEADSEAAYAALEQDSKGKQQQEQAKRKGKGPAVDPLSGLEDIAEVLKVEEEEEEEGGEDQDMDGEEKAAYYDAILTRIDVEYGARGQQLFYKMSALHNKVQDIYLLWTRWGSVGEDGMYQRTPFASREQCVVEFKKLFKSKTGVAWAERHAVEPKANKYKLQPLGGKTLAELQVEFLKKFCILSLPASTQLPPAVHFLLRIVGDSDLLLRNMVSSRPVPLPFGAANVSLIQQAFDILAQVKAVLEEEQQLAAAEEQQAGGGGGGDLEEDEGEGVEEQEEEDGGRKAKKAKTAVSSGGDGKKAQLKQTRLALSAKYYQLIPAVRRYGKLVFSTDSEVEAAVEELNQLCQQNAAGKILMAARQATLINPFEYMLAAMQLGIAVLDLQSAEGRQLVQYITATEEAAGGDGGGGGGGGKRARLPLAAKSHQQQDIEVVNIFAISRKGEAERFAPYAQQTGRLLLVHGTCAANVVGVLSDGLSCAPASAHGHGSLFGKGIYFADVAQKSLGYAQNDGGNPNTNNHKVLFVAEVYLGKCNEGTTNPGWKPGYDSVYVRGKTVPRELWVERATGALMPHDKSSKAQMPFSEYVIFNAAQIKLRYLVLVKAKSFQTLDDSKLKALPMYKGRT